AVVDREYAGDDVEHRGLAGAVRADQRGARAAPHLEREILDDREAAEALADVVQAKDRGDRGHRARSTATRASAALPPQSRSRRRSAPVSRPGGRSAITTMMAAANRT